MALCNFNPILVRFPLQGSSVSSFGHFNFRLMFVCLLPIAEIPGIFELFEGEKVWSLHQDKALELGSDTTSYNGRFRFQVLRDTSGGGEGKLWSHCEEVRRLRYTKKEVKKVGKNEHHLWKKNDSAGSGQKALNLVRMLSGLPNEKEAVYGALNKWVAWEVEFPIVAAAKALQILRKRSQWHRVIQVAKWMLSKGQGATMGTYDTLLLAFDMEERADEAESLWNMILHTHTRSIPRRLFARMIALYAHHDLQHKVIEVFADMEELKVRPDEDTARRVARAFRELGQEEKQELILRRYLSEYKYIYFNGERVRVKRYSSDEEG
ncbi:hypothetical protein YC2023_008300 [Brassica napus]